MASAFTCWAISLAPGVLLTVEAALGQKELKSPFDIEWGWRDAKRGGVKEQSLVLAARHSGPSVKGSVLRLPKLTELCRTLS